jgi:hypothetical protein
VLAFSSSCGPRLRVPLSSEETTEAGNSSIAEPGSCPRPGSSLRRPARRHASKGVPVGDQRHRSRGSRPFKGSALYAPRLARVKGQISGPRDGQSRRPAKPPPEPAPVPPSADARASMGARPSASASRGAAPSDARASLAHRHRQVPGALQGGLAERVVGSGAGRTGRPSTALQPGEAGVIELRPRTPAEPPWRRCTPTPAGGGPAPDPR